MMWPGLNRLIRPAVMAFCILAFVSLVNGCATSPSKPLAQSRPFVFANDTFAFNNELSWEYFFDANGKWTSRRREPQPEYSQHCFVVAHATKQFFQYAEFDPAAPRADEKTYRDLVRKIVFGGDQRSTKQKTAVPGYANLKEFSRSREALLKAECGGAWRSYFQRGHWRMILPFPRNHQEKASEILVRKLKENHIVVVHLVRFPQLSINHAVVIFGFRETGQGIEFLIYDPNHSEEPGILNYNGATRSFFLPTNAYFYGGKVNVYEIYHSCFY